MKFDELAEIYTSMTVRSVGFGMIGIFVPVYLYDVGVAIQEIVFFFFLMFVFRIPVSVIVAKIVARVGPKHTIALSTVASILFLGMLLSFESQQWPLALLSLVYTSSLALFFIAYNVDFSKIQHSSHGGKELGWLYAFEKLGMAAGPFVGGVVASIFVPELTLIVSILVLVVSLVPLFMTREPVKTHQELVFRGFPMKKHMRGFVSLGSFNAVNSSYNMLWPLFLAVFIFTEDAYFKLGALAAISVLVAVFAARMFGAFIDSRKGGALLRYGVGMGFILQISRALTTTAGGAVAVNTLGEPIMLAYRMPLVKGAYDAADSENGYRIVFMTWFEVWTAVAKALYYFALYIAMFHFDEIAAMRVSFAVLGVVGFGMLLQRFPALKKV